jgi:hypothetical protein
MPLDQPFPLHSLPTSARRAVLDAFNGRWPNIQEVAQIPDAHWLATPGIGQASLERLHSILLDELCQTHTSSQAAMTDAELLARLEQLQEELRLLGDQLRAKLPKALRRTHHSQKHSLATQDEPDH